MTYDVLSAMNIVPISNDGTKFNLKGVPQIPRTEGFWGPLTEHKTQI